MREKKRIRCFFEQSGTFRDMFRSIGHEAYSYDIANDYGKTDFKINLFEHIEKAYNNIITSYPHKENIFDCMDKDKDFIFAFFPCTFFSGQNELIFTAQQLQDKPKRQGNSISPKLIYSILDRDEMRHEAFQIFIKFCFVVDFLKIPTIIENPNCKGLSYLDRYSPYRCSYHDADRTIFGDNFVKPTDYYAINFDMCEDFYMFYDKVYAHKKVLNSNKNARSEITSTYARNLYNRFLKGKLFA